MLSLSIGRCGKLPVNVNAVQMELFEGLLERSDKLHTIRVIHNHLFESRGISSANPNENFKPRIDVLQTIYQLQSVANSCVELQFVVLDPDHADIYVRTQMRTNVARKQCGERRGQVVADQFRALCFVGFVNEIAETRRLNKFVFEALENRRMTIGWTRIVLGCLEQIEIIARSSNLWVV